MERQQPVVQPDTVSTSSLSPLQSATRLCQRLVPIPDGGYSSFSPLSDPILSDVSSADGWHEIGGAAVAVESGASPLMLSRNVADGTKNKLPVTAWLKSSSRS